MSDAGAAAPVPGLPGTGVAARPALTAMLEARSVALVGASPRPGSLGERMVSEVTKSPARPEVYLVNPRHERVAGRPCHASLADLPEPVDLVLMAVPDAAVEEQLTLAARRGDRSAVLFGSAHELPGQPLDARPGQRPGARPGPHPDADSGPQPGPPLTLRARLAATARGAGMAVCGAGCMGFVNVPYGLRAVGYVEPDPLPRGPVALITHSGSVFSALLRTRRGLGFTIAVSSGQELVTTAAQYAEYALGLPETRVLALVLEAIREPGRLRAVLAAARQRGIPVVMLTAGRSAGGRALVSAHSGALAAADGGWEALAAAYGVHRVGDLAEMADTLELFALRGEPPNPILSSHIRPSDPAVRMGIATVHDSGLERAHVADLADELGVPFAAIGAQTTARLAALLDPGLEPANPLDVWGTGARAQEQLTGSLAALADDPAVRAVALAVDLVHEFDGDDSYPLAVTETARRTSKPVVVLSNVPAAIDPDTAAGLRAGGIPVLEGTRSGLLALKHLLDHDSAPAAVPDVIPNRARRERWTRLIRSGRRTGHGWRNCSATTGSPRPGPWPRPVRPGRSPRPRTSAIRWCSRPASPASRISQTRAAWCWASVTRTCCRPLIRIWLNGWAAGCWSARRSRPVPSCPSAWPGITSLARCWWWAPAGSWWSCSPTGPWRCPRSARGRRTRCWARSGWPGCWPGCAASPPPTWTRPRPRSPACPSWPPNSATCSRRWTSTR